MKPRVAVLTGEGDGPPASTRTLEDVAELHFVDDPERLDASLNDVEILFVWDSERLPGVYRKAPSLRWIHAASLGVDGVLTDEIVKSKVTVTNTRGVFEQPIAEYVLALMLFFGKDFRGTLAAQEARSWEPRESELLCGQRLVILGAGGIARALAVLARAMGMEVCIVGRTHRADPEMGTIYSLESASSFLGDADVVVLAMPLTAETEGLVDMKLLDKMRRGVRIINVGRGATLDEDALLGAIRSGQVEAAGLDVFEEEPLPGDHPFWSMPEIFLSPHMSAARRGWQDEAVACFRRNLRRWSTGQPLSSVVKE